MVQDFVRQQYQLVISVDSCGLSTSTTRDRLAPFPIHKAGIENYSFFPAAKLNDEQLKREMQLGWQKTTKITQIAYLSGNWWQTTCGGNSSDWNLPGLLKIGCLPFAARASFQEGNDDIEGALLVPIFVASPQFQATLRAQHRQVEKHANIETLARALSHRRVHEKIIAEGWSCALIFVTRHPSDLRVMSYVEVKKINIGWES